MVDVLLRGVSISYNLSDKKKGKKNIKTLKKINVFRGGENYLLKYEQRKMENKMKLERRKKSSILITLAQEGLVIQVGKSHLSL